MPDGLSVARCALARRLYENCAVTLSELARLLDMEESSLVDLANGQDWTIAQVFEAGDSAAFNEIVAKMHSTASRTLMQLNAQLDALNKEHGKGFSSQAVKDLTVLTKGISVMEDMIKRMDAARHEAGSHPHDIVEFRRKLEKQISLIAERGAKA